MKKVLIAIAVLLISCSALFAYTDIFKDMMEDPLYVDFISAVKNNEKESEIIEKFNAFINSGITPVERARVEYNLVVYYVTVGDMNKAGIHKGILEALIDNLPSDTSEFERLAIDSPPIAGGNTKKAIKMIDDLFKNYGSEMTMLDKYSMLYAKALALNKRDDYKGADECFKEAFEYFDREPEVVEEYNKNLKKLK